MAWLPGGELAATSHAQRWFDLAGLVLPLCGSVLSLGGLLFAHRQHDTEGLKVDFLVMQAERDQERERAEKAEKALAHSEAQRVRLHAQLHRDDGR